MKIDVATPTPKSHSVTLFLEDLKRRGRHKMFFFSILNSTLAFIRTPMHGGRWHPKRQGSFGGIPRILRRLHQSLGTPCPILGGEFPPKALSAHGTVDAQLQLRTWANGCDPNHRTLSGVPGGSNKCQNRIQHKHDVSQSSQRSKSS